MKLFLDNDIILKLSSIGYLQDIEKIFDVEPSCIFILPSAYHYISKSKNVKSKYPQQVIAETLLAIKNYKSIPDDFVDENRFAQLEDIQGIDSGERLLFSINMPSDYLILTGDKKAIIQLNNSSNIKDIQDSLTGKIVCLETLILKLIEHYPFEKLSTKIVNSEYCQDTSIRMCFKQSNLTLAKAKEGLTIYFNDLKTHSGLLLFG